MLTMGCSLSINKKTFFYGQSLDLRYIIVCY